MSALPGIKRGAIFQAWDYGQMVAIGSRQPAGGIPGDCYREYPDMKADSVQDISKLFTYAYVSLFKVKFLFAHRVTFHFHSDI